MKDSKEQSNEVTCFRSHVQTATKVSLRMRTQGPKGFWSREDIRDSGFFRLQAPALESDSESLVAPSPQNQTGLSLQHSSGIEQPMQLLSRLDSRS